MSRLDSLLQLLDKEPNDSFVQYGIALEYLSRDNFKQAEIYLKRILDKDKDYIPAYMMYARLKEKTGNEEEARKIYRDGIEAANKIGDSKAAKEMEEFLDEL